MLDIYQSSTSFAHKINCKFSIKETEASIYYVKQCSVSAQKIRPTRYANRLNIISLTAPNHHTEIIFKPMHGLLKCPSLFNVTGNYDPSTHPLRLSTIDHSHE